MGKATIESSLGDGEYAITLHINTRIKKVRLDALTQEKAALVSRKETFLRDKATLDESLADLKAKEEASIQAITAARLRQANTYEDILDSIESLTGDVAAKREEVNSKNYTIHLNEESLKALQAERDAILAMPPPDNVPSPELLGNIGSMEAYILVLQDELSALESALQALIQQLTGKQSARDGFKFDIDKTLMDAQVKATADVQSKQNEINAVKLETDFIEVQIKANELAYAKDDAIPSERHIHAWCTDYSTTLTGEVGTIEIPGEINTIPVLVKAGYTDKAIYDQQADGELVSLEFMTPEQSWFNLAVLAYVNKFKLRFRRATIESIANDLATVILEETFTKQPGLEVTPKGKQTLEKVPFKYMECDALAFSVGDFVIVEFEGRDIGKPKIIGFADHPKPCDIHGFAITMADSHGIIKWRNTAYSRIDKTNIQYGSLYRRIVVNDKEYTVSFDGPYAGMWVGNTAGYGGLPDDYAKSAIYICGYSYPTPANVHGLGLCVKDGRVWIYTICQSYIYRAPYPSQVNADTQIEWELLGTYGSYNAEGFKPYVASQTWHGVTWQGVTLQASLWEFNQDCTELTAAFATKTGYASLVGTITGYNSLSIQWFDEYPNTILTYVNVRGWSFRDNDYFFMEGHYLSHSEIYRIIWTGYTVDGITTLATLYKSEHEAPDEWGLSMNEQGSITGPTPYWYGHIEDNWAPIQHATTTFEITLDGLSVTDYLGTLKYFNSQCMAMAMIGRDPSGAAARCDIFKGGAVVATGDNLWSGEMPPASYEKFNPHGLTEELLINDPNKGFAYQVMQDRYGNLLACIHDYTRVTSGYDEIRAYSKAKFLTNGNIPVLVGSFDTIMKIGVI
jgi:hypothetical protein